MTSEHLDAYLSRLALELENRGLGDARIVDEARDHLVDAIEDGLRRGLSQEAAERGAFLRFGAPEAVAAHCASERYRWLRRWPSVVAAVDRAVRRVVMYRSELHERGARMTSEKNDRVAGRLAIVWRRKWWVLVPTVLTAVVTSALSPYFVPNRYRSETSILVVPSRYADAAGAGPMEARLRSTIERVLSRARLERIIADLNLYEEERRTMAMDQVVQRMRNDIGFTITSRDQTGAAVEGFTVSFESSDPRAAQRGTERLASLFVEENLRASEEQVGGTAPLMDKQIEDVKRQILEYENGFNRQTSQAGRGGPPSRIAAIEYEVLLETYKSLLARRQEAKITATLERNQSVQQWKILDPARLPEAPVGPSPLRVGAIGGFAGLALGLLFVVMTAWRRSQDHLPPRQTA